MWSGLGRHTHAAGSYSALWQGKQIVISHLTAHRAPGSSLTGAVEPLCFLTDSRLSAPGEHNRDCTSQKQQVFTFSLSAPHPPRQALPVWCWLHMYYVDQVGLKLTEILLPLPPECWDSGHTPLFQHQSKETGAGILTPEWELRLSEGLTSNICGICEK